MAKELPIALSIILGIVIAAFPIMIIVISIYSVEMAMSSIKNYIMGYFALSFNLVSMALVHALISFYTAKNALSEMSRYGEVPYGINSIPEFMTSQADMAGLAGLIGTVSVFAVTPLIFYGEMKGFSAALGAVNSAFKGGVADTAKKTLSEYDVEATADSQDMKTFNGLTNSEAKSWLSENGFETSNSAGAAETYNQIMKGYSSLGAAGGNKILHAGNSDIIDNFGEGTAAQTHQKNMKTAGFGASADMASVGSVSFQDGEVDGFTMNSTARMREEGGYETDDVASGRAAQQYAKDMGSAHMGAGINDHWEANDTAVEAAQQKLDNAKKTEVEEAVSQHNKEKADAAAGLDAISKLEPWEQVGREDQVKELTEQANNDDDVLVDNSRSNAAQEELNTAQEKEGQQSDIVSSLVASSVNSAMQQIESGKGLIDTGAFNGNGSLANNAEAEKLALGTRASSAGKAASTMGLAEGIMREKGGFEEGLKDFLAGSEFQGGMGANKTIGVGEEWSNMNSAQQSALMKQVKENEQVSTFGGIKSTNEEIQKHAENGNGDAVAGAIKDMITSV